LQSSKDPRLVVKLAVAASRRQDPSFRGPVRWRVYMPAVCRPYDDDPDAGPIRPDEAVLYVVCVHLFICHNQRVAGWWYSTKFPLVRIQWAKGDIQIQYGGGVKPKCLCGLVCLPSQQGTEFPLNNKKKSRVPS